MLPIRFAFADRGSCRGCGLVFLLFGGVFLGSVEAAPLTPRGVDQFRALIDAKNDPMPTRQDAGEALATYRRKVRQAVKELPSLGEVANVLLLAEWNPIEFGAESPDVQTRAREIVVQADDDAFRRELEKALAKTNDATELSRAIIDEIKRDARLQLLERLETRTRFYLREARTEDRIAAANLLSQTMIETRRQDRHEALTSAGIIREPARRETAPGARSLRQRLAAAAGDLRKLLADSNPQVQAAGIRALSDLEIPPAELVAALEPLIRSKATPVATRRAAAEALGHVLSRVLEMINNLSEESRPQPRLRIVDQLLPVAVLGLSDEDVGVRSASLVACVQAARVLDELTRNQQMPAERRVVFQPTIQVVTKALPQINAVARDPEPALRVAACRVLETLVLASLRLRNLNPSTGPSIPNIAPPKEPGGADKGPLPLGDRRRTTPARPSQWAAVRAEPRVVTASPPRPLGAAAAPAAILERPIRLPVAAVPNASKYAELRTPNVDCRSGSLRPVAFVAQRPSELPPPTPMYNVWQPTVQAMIRNLRDPDYRVRLGAVDVLETLGDRAEAAAPALVQSLQDCNKFVRWGAARTLGRLAPRQAEDAVAGLARLLNDREDIGVRQAVLRALGEYGENARQAVPRLAQVINRGDKDYILGVLRTLQNIGTEAAPALPNVAWLLTDRGQPSSVRVEAAKTIGRFGAVARQQPRVLPILREVMLNDPDADVRAAASAAVLAVDRPLK